VITRCDHYIGPPLELGIDLLDLCHLDGVSRCWRAAYLDQTPQRPMWTGATTIANFADQPRKGTKSRSLQIRSVLSSQSRCAAPRSCARVLGGGGSTVGEVRATDAGDLRRDCQMRWCDGGLLGAELEWPHDLEEDRECSLCVTAQGGAHKPGSAALAVMPVPSSLWLSSVVNKMFRSLVVE
jgi:hypothetical protein